MPLLFETADLLDAPPSAPRPIAPKKAPEGLGDLQKPDEGPHLIFPPDGATVRVDSFGPKARGLVLAAGGETLTWYVEGRPLARDSVSHRAIWKPAGPGFYRLRVVDGQGRSATSQVRLVGEP